MYNYERKGSVVMKNSPLLVPFNVLKTKKLNTFIWFICILLFSNIAIIFAFFYKINIDGYDIDFMAEFLKTGALYLNGISLLASYIATISFDFINQLADTKFIRYKIGWLVIAIVSIILMSSNYLVVINIKGELTIFPIIFQFIMYLFSIIVSLFLFCISCMELEDEYDNYSKYDDDKRKEIKQKGEDSKKDGRGNKL